MQPYWSPLPGIQVGEQIYSNAIRNRLIDQQVEDANSMRKALALMGQGEQLAGFEDMPEAKRPDFLRQAYQMNPQAAMKMEQMLAAPYAMKREIQKQGEIEAAKRTADAQVWTTLAEKFGFAPGPQPAGGGVIPASMPIGDDGQPTPTGGAMPAPGLPLTMAPERSFELTPQGPKMGVKLPSGLDLYVKTDERRLANEQFKQKAQTDKEDLAIKQGELKLRTSTEQRHAVEAAHAEVRQLQGKILDVRKAMETRDIPWEQGLQEVAALTEELAQAKAVRDGLASGTQAPAQTAPPSALPSRTAPALTEKEMAGLRVREADPAIRLEQRKQIDDNIRRVQDQITGIETAKEQRQISSGAAATQLRALKAELQSYQARRREADGMAQMETAPEPPATLPSSKTGAAASGQSAAEAPAGSAPSASASPSFTEKEQAALSVKQREEKASLANKEIEAAREQAKKILAYQPHINSLFDLVTQHDIGHPVAGAMPYGQEILSLSPQNAQVRKLNEALTNMFIVPGQSGANNTMAERLMTGAQVPGLATDPQQNKQLAAVFKSNAQHNLQLPNFLERWQRTHGGTLDGANEAWTEYVQRNPYYLATKDKRGRVTVKENNHVLPMDQWMQLKEAGRIRTVGPRTFVQEDDGAWTER